MRAITTVFGAAVVVAAVMAPAAADYVRLGSVEVGFRTDSEVAYSRFGGRLESLRLTASRSDIFCRSVVVRFENGEQQNVFAGRLDERRPVEVDLRGRARKVDSVRFVCRSDEFRGGRINVEGEVGRYRDEWRRDRDWDRLWAGLFGGAMMGPDRGFNDRDRRDDWNDRDRGRSGDWSDRDRDRRSDWNDRDRDRKGDWNDRDRDRDRFGGGPNNEWVLLGQQSFEGRNDKESTFTGWGGRNAERIAFRAVNADAQCPSVVVTLDSGRKVKLADGRVWERGRMVVYDLPGRERNVSKVYLRCRALNTYQVTIEIYARR